jgi:hypothetical protein
MTPEHYRGISIIRPVYTVTPEDRIRVLLRKAFILAGIVDIMPYMRQVKKALDYRTVNPRPQL